MDPFGTLSGLPAPLLVELLALLDGPSALCVGGTCRRLRAASLSPALWPESARPPCAAWRRLPARAALVESLRADRRRLGPQGADEWRIAGTAAESSPCVAVDGDRAAVMQDGRVALYDLARCRRTHRFRTPSDERISGLCLRGDYLAILLPTDRAEVWEASDGVGARLRCRLAGRATHLCWLDDRTPVTYDDEGTVCVWDLGAGGRVARVMLHDLPVSYPTRGHWDMMPADSGLAVALGSAFGVDLFDPRLASPTVMHVPTGESWMDCFAVGGDRVLALQTGETDETDESGGRRVDVRDLRAPLSCAAFLPPETGVVRLAGVLRRGPVDALCCVHRPRSAHGALAFAAEEWDIGAASRRGPRLPLEKPPARPWLYVPFATADERRLVYVAEDGVRVVEHGASRSGRRDASHPMALRSHKRPCRALSTCTE